MSVIRGREFHLGEAVPRPPRENITAGTPADDEWRREWQERIEQAIRDEDAWGLWCTSTNCDVTLRDVLTPGAVWAATNSFSVRLLLVREVPRRA